LPIGSPALVENQGLPHPDKAVLDVDRLVPAGSLPETGGGGSVGASAGRILLVLVAEEEPVVLVFGSNLALFCKYREVK
jgi:hypothetical protein